MTPSTKVGGVGEERGLFDRSVKVWGGWVQDCLSCQAVRQCCQRKVFCGEEIQGQQGKRKQVQMQMFARNFLKLMNRDLPGSHGRRLVFNIIASTQ